MRVRAAAVGAHRLASRRGRIRRPAAISAAVALVAGLAIGLPLSPASAVQAPGDDVAVWANGWSWTYATSFTYNDPSSSTNVTINENVTYTNGGITTYNGQSVYQVNLTGSITGGSGATSTSAGNVSLDSFSGSVSGTEYVRRSDLALLKESQHQSLNAKAHLSFVSVGVTAAIDMTLTPTPGWKGLSFPLNTGDNWHESTNIAYTGGFSYDAGSLGGSGSSPFDGNFAFAGAASSAAQTINVPINSSLATDAVSSSGGGGAADNQWWSPGYKNVAKEHLVAPLDGASLTIDRSLSSASTPAPASSLGETITPSLTCAGAAVTVAGKLSSGTSGTPLTLTLDESAISPGQKVTGSTTTTAGGNYSTTLTAPAGSDGLAKNGARATWGVLVDGGGASSVATLVVSNQDCTSLSYTGDTAGSVGTSGTVSAKLVDLATGSGINGQSIAFALAGGSTVHANTNASGVASTTVPLNTPVRTAAVAVSYAGTSTLTASTAAGSIVIGQDPTSTSVVSSAPTATIGDPLTFTAIVTPVIGSGPTGAVQFVVDGSNFGAAVPLSGNQATSAALSTLGLGDHTITATYSGDSVFSGSSSPVITVHVHNPLTPTTTTLDLSPSTSAYGQSVTLTSTVTPHTGSGHPTGTVTFTDGGTLLGTVAVTTTGAGDQAALSTAALSVGSHNIVATYSGDDDFDSSASAPGSQTVTQASTSTTVSTPDTSTVSGEAVNYTATVTAVAPGDGQPTGSAQLNVDGAASGDPVTLIGGVAVFPAVTSLGAGAHTITVAYSGSPNFAASTGTTTQDVAKAATSTSLTATPSPSSEDQNVRLTATVTPQAPGSGSPTGTVTFFDGASAIGVGPVTAGIATLDIDSLAPGGHSLTAEYVGDGNYTASTSDAISHTVIEGSAVQATTTTLVSSANPSTFGLPITFTATVATTDPAGATPDGSVQFAVDGTDVGDPVALDGGTAVSPTLASPEPGDHLVTVVYLPTAAFAASGASLTQTVAAAGVGVVLGSSDETSDFGQSVHFHATVTSQQLGTGKPTGSVQFRVDGVALGAPVALEDGAADSVATSTLAPGAHTVTVLYTGNVDFLPESAALTQTVNLIGTATTVASSLNPATYGQSVTFTATVTPDSSAAGAPAGTVTFTDGTLTLGTAPIVADGNLGKATLTVASLDAGSHPVRAAYSGSATFTASTSPVVTEAVARAATAISAQAAVLRLLPLGLPLGTLRATLYTADGPLAGRPLVFKIGSLTACTATTDANGVATCSALKYLLNLTLALGYKVSFAGDPNHLGSAASAGIIK